MLGDTRQADVEGGGQFIDGGFAFSQPRKDRAPRRVGERGKNRVELSAKSVSERASIAMIYLSVNNPMG